MKTPELDTSGRDAARPSARADGHRTRTARVRAIVGYTFLAVLSFGGTYALTRRANSKATAVSPPAPAATEPDSVILQRMGIHSGTHINAYLFVSTRCGVCQSTSFRTAIRGFPGKFKDKYRDRYADVSVTIVNIDSNLEDALAFATGKIGLEGYDEVAVGRNWLNREASRLMWTGGASTAVPQIVLVRRAVAATASPLMVNFSQDTILAAISGGGDVAHWLDSGMPIPGA